MNQQPVQPINPSTYQPSSPPYSDPDEINLLEYVYALVKAKWWIIGATVLGLVAGIGLAYHKGPRYVAEVTIAPKETDSKTPNLSGLGAIGGLMAAQLSLGGNASLDKIDLVLNSREFNAELIERYNMLPEIYRYYSPKTFNKIWDSTRNDWRPGFMKPKRLGMGSSLKGAFLKKVSNKNGTMTLSVKSKDSTFSEVLLHRYLEHLNDYIKSSVQKDANSNVEYLDKRIATVSDPLLREKIQGLIASEVEKSMLVSNEAFRIVDPVYRTKQFKEKRLYPMAFGTICFLMMVLASIIHHVIASADKTEEDRKLIAKIRKEIFSLPRR